MTTSSETKRKTFSLFSSFVMASVTLCTRVSMATRRVEASDLNKGAG